MKVVCHHETLGSEGFQTHLTQWCAQREQWEGETLCRGEQEGNREKERERERERERETLCRTPKEGREKLNYSELNRADLPP
jgi:hypothetical protein